MKELYESKEIYDSIQIPEELEARVQKAILSVDKQKIQQKKRSIFRSVFFKYGTGMAAAVMAALLIGLNTSEVFAQSMGELPVIGSIARVFTLRSYTEDNEDTQVKVEVAGIEVQPGTVMEDTAQGMREQEEATQDKSNEQTAFVADINAEIENIVDSYVADAKVRMQEYKEAFFETGGTEEEWADRSMDIHVSYEVKYQEGPYLSLILTNSEGWFAAYEERIYYNLDLENSRNITLKDLLGEDYIAIANAEIDRQIEERVKADENNMYWGYGSDDMAEEKFRTIDDTTTFYINEKGNPVITFPKYEIAPGYMGVQEFEIVKEK